MPLGWPRHHPGPAGDLLPWGIGAVVDEPHGPAGRPDTLQCITTKTWRKLKAKKHKIKKRRRLARKTKS
ncbi:hypothetical protein GPECTOR_5g395 [Gonium pectorale]|uniref:Uncharacterized protein n=1 Tax=Gonium pectorale TaxID=33097 RepID=A0A150GYC1_GONPE|nr:hypothetical protein GPECTOR_5g395 [Gonium pectorale]|eukprot:KXZ54310.1 hypothetical protein GPECTOR_5g395 [Gonium pectorale]